MRHTPELHRVFISFASPERDTVAAPVARALKRRGYSVWYDSNSLAAGASLRSGLDDGLRTCDFGLVILSESYFEASWANDELSGLLAREKATDRRLIIPIWHNVTQKQVSEFSPIVADRVALSTSRGMRPLINGIVQALKYEDRIDGVSVFSFMSDLGGRLEIRAAPNTGQNTKLKEDLFTNEKIAELEKAIETFASKTTLKGSGRKKLR